MKPSQAPLKLPEFVTLLAMMTSIMALSIDAMLPALGDIASELNLADPNDAQLVVSAMFFGFALGQIAAGPLSDSFGRKPIIYLGYMIFIAGCILSIQSTDFTTMLIGRCMQGLGAAAPRIVGMALVRDGYAGRDMARIMSIVMAIFILVPAIAPAIGQMIIFYSGWRTIFLMLLVTAVLAFMWFTLRQPETLSAQSRRKFSLGNIVRGIGEVLSYREVRGYTIASGIVFGGFLGYLNSAQQIFQETYNTGQLFAVYFGVAALAVGAASVFNSKLVVRLGMRYLAWRAIVCLTIVSACFAVITVMADGIPPLWSFMIWLLLSFFCIGILLGNFNSMAMEPLGHMAGLGAAVFGSFSTFISMPIGLVIGAQFNGTIQPMVFGFAIFGLLSLLTVWWTEHPKTTQPT